MMLEGEKSEEMERFLNLSSIFQLDGKPELEVKRNI